MTTGSYSTPGKKNHNFPILKPIQLGSDNPYLNFCCIISNFEILTLNSNSASKKRKCQNLIQ